MYYQAFYDKVQVMKGALQLESCLFTCQRQAYLIRQCVIMYLMIERKESCRVTEADEGIYGVKEDSESDGVGGNCNCWGSFWQIVVFGSEGRWKSRDFFKGKVIERV